MNLPSSSSAGGVRNDVHSNGLWSKLISSVILPAVNIGFIFAINKNRCQEAKELHLVVAFISGCRCTYMQKSNQFRLRATNFSARKN